MKYAFFLLSPKRRSTAIFFRSLWNFIVEWTAQVSNKQNNVMLNFHVFDEILISVTNDKYRRQFF
jgi:hypothetical protein